MNQCAEIPNVEANLRAGAAAVCITPPVGAIISGELAPRVAQRIHDDLFVRALALDDGETKLAFAIVDTCVLDRPLCDEAKRLIQHQIGLPPENVLVSAVHTHSGGAACGVHLTEADDSYRCVLPARIAEAVCAAVNRLVPAQVGWARGAVPQHVFCRRLLIKTGFTYVNQLGQTGERVKMNWDSPHPADGEPAGPVDPELFVLSIQHTDGRPLAVLANYSLHYVGDVPAGDISADYFGVFARRVAELLGADSSFVAILSNGTSGDINNWDPKVGPGSPAPYWRVQKVAGDVAEETLRVLRHMQYRRDVRLRTVWRECKLATRRPTSAELEQARALVAGRSPRELITWRENYAREQVLLADYPPEVSLPLQVFRIGELAVAAWPGEIFAVSGLALKSRHQPLFNIELANGWFGYIPPPEQFQLGGYETWRMRTSFLEINALPKLLACFEEMLR
ncbi:MAG: hypothetical protein N3B01_00355 [Verrucomicrobiae bacterium]|nr:hypothetical protein [Verrucomicrobiae bacterium]